MKVRNLRDRAVVLAVPGHPPVEAEAGETIEVDDDLGQLLAEQPDRWKPVTEDRSVADGEEN